MPKRETSEHIFEKQRFIKGERGNYDDPKALKT